MFSPSRTQNAATRPERDATDDGRGREGFRPVALPALAAAVQIAANAAQAARAKRAARKSRPFVHEDDPTV